MPAYNKVLIKGQSAPEESQSLVSSPPSGLSQEQLPKIAVILGTPGVQWKNSGTPFAHIIALRDGEIVAAKARQCIHVFADEDGYETADGVLAVQGRCAVIGALFEWPVLSAALLLPVKAFAGLTNARAGQPPHQRLKNLVEDGFSGFASPEHEDGYAAKLLDATQSWNEWNRNGITIPDRCREVYGRLLWADKPEIWRLGRIDAFGKLCRKVGLQFGVETPSELPMKELSARLVVARQLFERLSAA